MIIQLDPEEKQIVMEYKMGKIAAESVYSSHAQWENARMEFVIEKKHKKMSNKLGLIWANLRSNWNLALLRL